jgi:hypothetical protein
MSSVKKMQTITLVDISRSTEGKMFETTMSLAIYNKQKAKGKIGPEWIEKSKIESIDVTEVNDPAEAITEVVEEVETVEETVVEEEKVSYSEMTKPELVAELEARGIEFNQNDRKIILIALLTEADNA